MHNGYEQVSFGFKIHLVELSKYGGYLSLDLYLNIYLRFMKNN